MGYKPLAVCFLLGLLIGCKPAATPPKPNTDSDTPEQAAVRQEFNRLKAAIAALREGKDSGDGIWDLLGTESQTDAEREAREVKAAYAKLADKEKAELEKIISETEKDTSLLTLEFKLLGINQEGGHLPW